MSGFCIVMNWALYFLCSFPGLCKLETVQVSGEVGLRSRRKGERKLGYGQRYGMDPQMTRGSRVGRTPRWPDFASVWRHFTLPFTRGLHFSDSWDCSPPPPNFPLEGQYWFCNKEFILSSFSLPAHRRLGSHAAPGKGLSQSGLPCRRSVPTWLKLTSNDVKEQICKLAKKGLTPSKSVWPWETHIVLHKYVLWQAIQSWEFLSLKDLLLIFLRISTI